MRLLIYLMAGLICSQTLMVGQQPASSSEYESRTRVGQVIPAFTVTDTTGRLIDIRELKPKVVLVNFWATWCGPCRAEIPRLEKEIWQRYKSGNFFMVGIAREQSNDDIVRFKRKTSLTYPLAADPHRAIYKLFADAGIPRSYVVGPDGTILFQTVGYDQAEFAKLQQVIADELAKTGKARP